MIDVEQLRDYCLSLGADVEERMPFGKFHGASEVLVFYVCGHMFCYFDIARYECVSVKCEPERIVELRAQHECLCNPYNLSAKHWLGITVRDADRDLVTRLVSNSYRLVKAKYSRQRATSR